MNFDSKLTEEQRKQGFSFLKEILDRSPGVLSPTNNGDTLALNIAKASDELAKYFLCIKD